jgi:hypothetical protein
MRTLVHPEVPPTEVFVLMVIANYANEHGANAYPSFDTLKKDLREGSCDKTPLSLSLIEIKGYVLL